MSIQRTFKVLVFLLAVAAIIFSWERAASNASGPSGGYSNAPSESNCTSCHSGSSFNSNSSLISLTSSSGSSLEYYPDTVYNIEISFSKSGTSKFGFEVTALDATNNKMAGSFTLTNTSTTRTTTASFSGNTRTYVTQTSGGTSGSGSITWKFNWKAPSTNVGDVKFYVVVNATNNNNTSSGDVIYGNTFTFKALNLKSPVPSISFSPAKPCEGDTVYFKGAGTNNPTSYAWTFQNGTPATASTQDAKAVFSNWGSFKATLAATNSDGTGTTVQVVSISPKPSDKITAAGSLTFCEGDSLKLTAPAGASYAWSTGENTASIYVKKSASYTVTVENANGCSRTSLPADVIVKARPVITLNRLLGADSVCVGDSIKLEILPAGLSFYDFYNGKQLLFRSNQNIFAFKPNGVIKLYDMKALGTDSIGCVSDSSNRYSIAVHAPLGFVTGLKATNTTTSSATISWDPLAGALGYEASTDTGKSWQSTGSLTNYTASGRAENSFIPFIVRATDNSACRNGAESKLTVKTLPCSELTYDVSYDRNICRGDSVSISFSNFSSGQYALKPAAAAQFRKDTEFRYRLWQDTTLEFLLFDSAKANCDPFSVKLDVALYNVPNMAPTFNRTGICPGQDVQVTASSGFASYNFYVNSALVHTSTSRIYSFKGLKDGDIVGIEGITVNNCASNLSLQAITLNAVTDAAFSYTAHGLDISFTHTGSNAVSWDWDFGDGQASTDQNPEHTYSTEGAYQVALIATSRDGCTDTTTQALVVTTSGLAEQGFTGVTIYPTPFGDQIFIQFHTARAGMLYMSLTDMLGRNVYAENRQVYAGSNKLGILTGQVQPGIYYLNMWDNNGHISRQVVKY